MAMQGCRYAVLMTLFLIKVVFLCEFKKVFLSAIWLPRGQHVGLRTRKKFCFLDISHVVSSSTQKSLGVS